MRSRHKSLGLCVMILGVLALGRIPWNQKSSTAIKVSSPAQSSCPDHAQFFSLLLPFILEDKVEEMSLMVLGSKMKPPTLYLRFSGRKKCKEVELPGLEAVPVWGNGSLYEVNRTVTLPACPTRSDFLDLVSLYKTEGLIERQTLIVRRNRGHSSLAVLYLRFQGKNRYEEIVIPGLQVYIMPDSVWAKRD